jgi:electron transport complex protein RnfD
MTDFAINPAPHTRPRASVPVIMRRVLYALAPAAACHVWYFGAGIILNFIAAALTGLAAEAIVLKLRGRSIHQPLRDGSVLVTAALLAFSIPPLTPWWVPACGSLFAIIVGKHLYGGLGKNLFNPAMVGYVFLLLSFPVEMTQWVPPSMGDLDYRHLGVLELLRYAITGALPVEVTIDALTRATPLDLIKEGVKSFQTIDQIRANSLFGEFGGRGWEWIANFIGLGGLYLLYTRTIRWHIPTAVLAGLLMPSAVLYLINPDAYPPPGFHLFSGAALLCAFFIATDPVSAAAGTAGRLIFGVGIGLLTFAIRTWGGYPDGVAFAVLLMNASVPLIDRYTRPRIFGHA